MCQWCQFPCCFSSVFPLAQPRFNVFHLQYIVSIMFSFSFPSVYTSRDFGLFVLRFYLFQLLLTFLGYLVHNLYSFSPLFEVTYPIEVCLSLCFTLLTVLYCVFCCIVVGIKPGFHLDFLCLSLLVLVFSCLFWFFQLRRPLLCFVALRSFLVLFIAFRCPSLLFLVFHCSGSELV